MQLSLHHASTNSLNKQFMMTFSEAIQSLPSFISEMQADWEMVYDWMIDMCEIAEFSDEENAELAITYAQYAD